LTAATKSSNGGLLLLRQAERKLGICGRLADAMPDRRDASLNGQKIETVEKAGIASPGQRWLRFSGQSMANRLAWRANVYGAYSGLRHEDGGPGAVGTERIFGRRKSQAQAKGRLKLTDAERATLGQIGHRLGRKVQCDGPVRCRERLGGLLRYYHQEAA
jgi:hypothetical protein